MENNRIVGKVIEGERVARKMNYPTANLDISLYNFDTGVYACNVLLDNAEYNGAMVIKDNPKKGEVYLMGYDGDEFYGKEIEVYNMKKVSDIETKEGEELKNKVEKDIILIKNFLNI